MKKAFSFLFNLPLNIVAYVLRGLLFLIALIGFISTILTWILLEIINMIVDKDEAALTTSPDEVIGLTIELFLSKKYWRWLKFRVNID